MFSIVVMKFIVLSIDEILVRWRLKIVRLIDFFEWFCRDESGGYIVYFVFVFCFINVFVSSRISEGGSS